MNVETDIKYKETKKKYFIKNNSVLSTWQKGINPYFIDSIEYNIILFTER
jgi:hypothetical protein